MAPEGYVYDPEFAEERARLAGIEALWDPGTQRLLAELGAARGARVLEAGAGGGAIVEWLAAAVGEDGLVLAVDIDTRFLDGLASDTVKVARLDLVADELPEDGFDLVHARLLLEHLPQRDRVLAKLSAALRPGGRILIEDYDWTGFGFDSEDELDRAVVEAVLGFMAQAGFERDYGRRLRGKLESRGLRDVRVEGRSLVIDNSDPGSDFFRLSLVALAPAVVGAGLLTQEQADEAVARMPTRRLITPSLMAAAGTRA